MKRRKQVEMETNTNVEDYPQPAEASVENEKGKEVESVDPQKTGLEEQMPTTATGQPKAKGLPRGLSFRAPPVFRASTDPAPPKSTGPKSMPHHLRRFQSQPGNQANAGRVGNTPPNPKGASNGQQPRPAEEANEPPMSQTASIILLLASTGLIALCAEFLVGSIQHLVKNSPLSEAFIGLIILPIVGNAAEHVTAVTVAAKNKVDLALGVCLGSSIQIALFVTPVVVILGWILDKNMSLYFNLFETASLFVSTFIVNFLVLDGRSNYLEGALLCACYVIIG
jgi:Ca2+:H+ antiporter